MLGLLVSRALGVVRQIIFSALFGTGPAAAAYVVSSNLPDTLFNLIAGGALTNAFVPIFLSYEKNKGEMEAWRLTSLVFNVLLVAITLVVTVAEFLTPAYVSNILIRGYPEIQPLTTSLTRIMLVQTLILGVGTVATGVLNSKRQFLLPAVSIAVYNFGVIGGLLVTKMVPGVGIYGPTYGVVAAAILQTIILFPALFKQGMRYSFVWNLRDPGLQEILRLLLPSALATGVSYVGVLAGVFFSSYLTDRDSIAALHYADMLQALPAALIGQAISQSLLPHLAVQAAAGRYIRMRQTALKVIGISILITVPAAIVLAVAGQPLIHLLFQHGAFTQHSSDLTNLALLGYVCTLPGQAGGVLLSSAFFALKDARTPFLTNTYALVSRWGMLYLLFHLLAGSPFMILAVPLASVWSSTSESVILCVLLLLRLRKYIKQDKGMQRLQRYRLYLQGLRQQTLAVEHSSD